MQAEFSGAGEAQSARHTTLAALCIIARHHGIHLAPDQLAKTYALDAEEPSSVRLMAMADEAGLITRKARLSWRQLLRLGKAYPVMLRMRTGQAIVVTGVSTDNKPPVVMLRDPLGGANSQLAVDEVRLREVWDGEVIFFKRRYAFREDEKPFDAFWLMGAFVREGKIFRDAFLAALMMSVFAVAPIFIIMVVLDKLLTHQRLSTLTLLASFALFVIVFDTMFGFLRRQVMAVGGARVDARLSEFVFARLIDLPISFFERTPAGVVMYKVNELWRLRNVIVRDLFPVVVDSMALIFLLPIMFILNATLTLYVLGLVVFMFAVVILYLGPMARAYGKVIEADQARNQFLVETIHGIRTIKSLALEGRRRREWDVRAATSVRTTEAMAHLSNQPQTILQPLEKLIYLGSMLVGSYLIIAGDEPALAGGLIAFSMLAARATGPFVKMAGLIQQLQQVRGSVGQVASVVNEKPEQQRGVRGVRPEIRGAIEISDVKFRYPGSQANALDGVTLSVPEGSMVGIMGRSGSGKTTLTRLLQGLHRDYEGLIKIDGVDLKEIDIDHLRSSLGVVLQDNFLFRGTIRENIMAARTDAALEDVIACARLAGAEEFIERLPKGYDTWVEEGSANLSGGQRQRLAIARALLVDPPILIFDEATSALDPDSEAIVNASLSRIGQGRTVIVISHRLTSLIDCNPIVVMERGKVYDVGKHEDLLTKSDIYRQLWYKQNRHLATGVSHDRAIVSPTSVG